MPSFFISRVSLHFTDLQHAKMNSEKISASGTFLNIFLKIKDISASIFLLKQGVLAVWRLQKHKKKKCRQVKGDLL